MPAKNRVPIGRRAIIERVRARVVLFLGFAIATGGALNGCERPLTPRMTGDAGSGGTTGSAGTMGRGGMPARGGTTGSAGTTGSGGTAFGEPACASTVTKAGMCAPEDQQLCYKTCGPDKLGVKSETCAGGIYAEMSGCTFDASRDYSCYQIPSTANTACSMTPVAGTPCSLQPCMLCNSTAGLPGGTYSDSAGAPKIGYCICSGPDAAGETRWSCASDTAWPCPLGAGCSGPGTGGRGGTTGAAGTTGTAGTSGAAGTMGPSCTGLVTAAGVEPTKGYACSATDPQLCYKTCGPEKLGTKSETCMGGVYAEMSGCAFDQSRDYSCYQIPSAANATCPAGVTPQASQDCAVDHCTVCNSTGGLPGGTYLDSAGAAKLGYCVCQPFNADGKRTWSCANDTQWPCPGGRGCTGTGGGGTGGGGRGGSTGTGGTGAVGGTGGASGTGGAGGSPFQPTCPSSVVKGGTCQPTDIQLCYKACGPENTGGKSDTCVNGIYAEMSGCSFSGNRDFSCYRLPAAASAACPPAVLPMSGSPCDVPYCTLCNSTGGLPGGHYLDAAAVEKMGYCVCQQPSAAGTRTWSCASDTAWPCPAGLGC